MVSLRTFRCSVLRTSSALRGIQSEFSQAGISFRMPADLILTYWIVRGCRHVQQRSCHAGMVALRHYATDANQTLQLGWDNQPATFNQTLAAFLILRGPSALFAFDVVGPYECASTGCGCDSTSIANQGCNPEKPKGYRLGKWSPLLELDYGHPIEAPALAGRVWSREWSKASIALNCSSWEARIELK